MNHWPSVCAHCGKAVDPLFNRRSAFRTNVTPPYYPTDFVYLVWCDGACAEADPENVVLASMDGQQVTYDNRASAAQRIAKRGYGRVEVVQVYDDPCSDNET